MQYKNRNLNGKFLGSWVPEMTLRTFWKQADNIHESCKSEMQRTASETTQIRVIIMEKLVKMLAQGRQHKYQCVIPLSTTTISVKAKSLFDKLNATDPGLKVTLFSPTAVNR